MRKSFRTSTVAAVVMAFIVATGVAAGPAEAVEYPSWDDVTAAQGNEASKQAEITRIQDLIAGLAAETAAATQRAADLGIAYESAQARYDTAFYTADQLRAAADQAQTDAEQSQREVGRLAAQLARTGDAGMSVSLLLSDSASADSLLYQLGAMSKLTATTGDIYERAARDQNAARSLTDQADVAARELDGLAQEADRNRDDAIASQDALTAALTAEESHRADLEAQLQVLSENRVATEADYNAGVAARAAAEAAAAKAAAEAAAAAAAAAGAAPETGAPSAGDPAPAASGWASPFPNAFSTDEYGMRVNPVDGGYRLHAGLDLAYNRGTCGASVYAAADGQVNFAGPNGGLGNNVEISHGGGIVTSYSHNTSVLVNRGQSVAAGQLIAYAGTTGNSTGCHLHFETRVGGSPQNPRDFMSDRGIYFG